MGHPGICITVYVMNTVTGEELRYQGNEKFLHIQYHFADMDNVDVEVRLDFHRFGWDTVRKTEPYETKTLNFPLMDYKKSGIKKKLNSVQVTDTEGFYKLKGKLSWSVQMDKSTHKNWYDIPNSGVLKCVEFKWDSSLTRPDKFPDKATVIDLGKDSNYSNYFTLDQKHRVQCSPIIHYLYKVDTGDKYCLVRAEWIDKKGKKIKLTAQTPSVFKDTSDTDYIQTALRHFDGKQICSCPHPCGVGVLYWLDDPVVTHVHGTDKYGWIGHWYGYKEPPYLFYIYPIDGEGLEICVDYNLLKSVVELNSPRTWISSNF